MWNKLRKYYYNLLYRIERYWWEYHTPNSKINGECIMYHHVTNENIDDIPPCICRVDVFENTIRKLIENNIAIVNPNEMLSIIRSKDTKKFALITFDDIPESVFTNAYPILKKYNIPFTIFVAIKYIGKIGFISIEQLKILSEEPLCTIGAHTLTHTPLRKANYKKEIFESKKILESIIGKPVDIFAYPYGTRLTIPSKCIKEVSKIYRCAFSTIQTNINDYTSKKIHFLPRIVKN